MVVAVLPLREMVLETTYHWLSDIDTLQLALVQVEDVPVYVKLAVKVAFHSKMFVLSIYEYDLQPVLLPRARAGTEIVTISR